MSWFRRSTRGPEPPESAPSAVRPPPQIIEAGCDGEEGAELIFAETSSTLATTESPKKLNNSAVVAVALEEGEPRRRREEERSETASSISVTKDLPPPVEDQETMESRGRLMRRLAALFCLLLVITAIALGIVFGTKDKNAPPVESTANSSSNGQSDKATLSDVIGSEECVSSSELFPDGSSDVGVISTDSESSSSSSSSSPFTNGGGKCGEASYGIGPGTWYHVSGTGGFMNLSACASDCTVPDSALAIPEVSVFTGDDCSDLTCVAGVANLIADNNNTPFQFEAVLGQDYYIYVQGGENTSGLFEITLTEV